jgi:tryptophan synthase alpha chain
MNPLRSHLDALRREGRTAMGLFLTSGFPEPAATGPILDACVDGGADFVELGMPFSDPLAEGLPIQRASARALGHGVTMRDAFHTAETFATRHADVPLVLMGYVNPVLRYGLDAFCRDAAAAGVAGLILPDLPPEEAAALESAASQSGLGLAFLIAPNTSDARVRLVDEHSTGFVYAVSTPGLTGQALADHDRVATYLARARGLVTCNPLLVGFGIRTGADAARLTPHTDGFIVGSALVERCAALWDDPSRTDAVRLDAVADFVRGLRPHA